MGRRTKEAAGVMEPPEGIALPNDFTRGPAPSELTSLKSLDDSELSQLENELVTQMRKPEKQQEAGLKDLAHALRCVALVQAMRIKLQMEKTGEGRMIGIEELEARLSEVPM